MQATVFSLYKPTDSQPGADAGVYDVTEEVLRGHSGVHPEGGERVRVQLRQHAGYCEGQARAGGR